MQCFTYLDTILYVNTDTGRPVLVSPFPINKFHFKEFKIKLNKITPLKLIPIQMAYHVENKEHYIVNPYLLPPKTLLSPLFPITQNPTDQKYTFSQLIKSASWPEQEPILAQSINPISGYPHQMIYDAYDDYRTKEVKLIKKMASKGNKLKFDY